MTSALPPPRCGYCGSAMELEQVRAVVEGHEMHQGCGDAVTGLLAAGFSVRLIGSRETS